MRDLGPRIREILERLAELEQRMVDPAVLGDRHRAKELGGELKHLQALARPGRRYLVLQEALAEAEELLRGGDAELKELAQAEKRAAEDELPGLAQELERLLIPRDADDDRNLILEIRAGTGGEEAGLFAADLLRMYERYAERKGWRLELLSLSEGAAGGYKEVTAAVRGEGAYGRLKYESGVHRVQRVPATESQGRIHTSAASVAVLPEVDEVEVELDPNELRIDVYRSSGPGGQSVNTTDSAVRITHLPSGLVVSCQDEKSQHKNKAKGLKILAARLYDLKKSERDAAISAQRRDMVGSGDRSAKIRTYNFPQSRLTDHRIGFTAHNLPAMMEGDLDELMDALKLDVQERLLAAEDA
jgi:peptide chain release factor 1